MSVRDTALTVAVLKVLADEIANRLAAAKAVTEAGFRDTGTSQAVPQLPGGMKVATVTYAGEGGKSASVTNPAALLAWVLENHPGETETVIRESYRKKLLDTAKAAGQPVDPVTGELVPGITVGDSRPYVSVRFKPGGQDAVIAAWRAGELPGIEVTSAPAITEGAAA